MANGTKAENYRIQAAKDLLSSNLKAALRRHGWNGNMHYGTYAFYLYQIASKHGANVGEGALSNWIWGVSLPRYSSLLALAKWLECGPETLLEKKFWNLLKGFENDEQPH